jgi:2-keto-4-pentenoate hydratase/2-oxohepta-3-ene-1,7-dioic acid hydratase in catechol pathway
MRLASYRTGGESSFGIVSGTSILDLKRRTGLHSLRELLANPTPITETGAADWAIGDVTFEPVIPNPGKIICVGLNYHEHIVESGRAQPLKPVLFARYPGTQVGHDQPIVRPAVSAQLDFEGELAVVIGTPGRHIAVENALRHVAGYACYNDGSVRDWQAHTAQYLPGKNFLATGAFGPWLVTADEIPDPTTLTLETRLNGAVMQHATVDLMINPIPELIAYCSTFLPLEPGDVIVTGTPGGVGARRTPPVWMKPGDVVEVEVSTIGVLRNEIVEEGA